MAVSDARTYRILHYHWKRICVIKTLESNRNFKIFLININNEVRENNGLKQRKQVKKNDIILMEGRRWETLLFQNSPSRATLMLLPRRRGRKEDIKGTKKKENIVMKKMAK